MGKFDRKMKRQGIKAKVTERLDLSDLAPGTLVNLVVDTSWTLPTLVGAIADYAPKLRATGKSLFLSISGYDHDPRELHQIPEVRALCQRIVESGFIDLLGDAEAIGDTQRIYIDRLSCWLMAQDAVLLGQGGRGGQLHVSPAMHEEFARVLEGARAKVDRIVTSKGGVTP